jgi:cell division protein FtsB
MTDAANMTDTDRLAFQNEVLHRRVAALEADVAELERERDGLEAEVGRLRERLTAALDGSGRVDRP